MLMRTRLVDITGRRFGRLTAVRYCATSYSYVCRCDCGQVKTILSGSLRSGATRSCGCLHTEQLIRRCTTHGQRHTLMYGAWKGMIQRCENPNHQYYHRYGGRNIHVCKRWHKFELFLKDMGFRPPNTQIDRRNNDGNYEPGNCQWITKQGQNNNTSRTRFLRWNGQRLSVRQWSENLGLPYRGIIARLNRGWSVKKTMTFPFCHAKEISLVP